MIELDQLDDVPENFEILKNLYKVNGELFCYGVTDSVRVLS